MLRISGTLWQTVGCRGREVKFEDEVEEGALAVNCVSGGRMEEARHKSIDFAEKAY
jgi:hypothetical protein